MIKPNLIPISPGSGSRSGSREIQLFEPPADAVYTIEATSRIVDVPRRTILVYCKYQLVSPAMESTDHGYCFNRDSIHALRRIHALRSICGNDFAGIRIILELTAALERLRSDLRLLSGTRGQASAKPDARNISSRKMNVKPSSWRKLK
jgi:DNA-binding transcriptional MerR regulator